MEVNKIKPFYMVIFGGDGDLAKRKIIPALCHRFLDGQLNLPFEILVISRSIGLQFNEKSIVNGIIGLLATGGSTNHTLHILAMANAAGIKVTWKDFSDLSEVIPSICEVYPNGAADINHFHASGGMAFVTRTLLDHGLLHNDVSTVFGTGMEDYTKEPKLIDGRIEYVNGPRESLNSSIIRSCSEPFNSSGD